MSTYLSHHHHLSEGVIKDCPSHGSAGLPGRAICRLHPSWSLTLFTGSSSWVIRQLQSTVMLRAWREFTNNSTLSLFLFLPNLRRKKVIPDVSHNSPGIGSWKQHEFVPLHRWSVCAVPSLGDRLTSCLASLSKRIPGYKFISWEERKTTKNVDSPWIMCFFSFLASSPNYPI